MPLGASDSSMRRQQASGLKLQALGFSFMLWALGSGNTVQAQSLKPEAHLSIAIIFVSRSIHGYANSERYPQREGLARYEGNSRQRLLRHSNRASGGELSHFRNARPSHADPSIRNGERGGR